jgi:hypothetical protein
VGLIPRRMTHAPISLAHRRRLAPRCLPATPPHSHTASARLHPCAPAPSPPLPSAPAHRAPARPLSSRNPHSPRVHLGRRVLGEARIDPRAPDRRRARLPPRPRRISP